MKRETRWKLEGAAVVLKWVFLCGVAFAIGSMLAGCNATLPVLPARTAIPVECKEPIPQKPAMPTDNLTPESSLDASVQAMEAALALHEGYEDQLVTALKACTAPINQPPRSTP